MKYFGITDKGKIRDDNQDSFLIEKCDVAQSLIVALCDGMGGENAGNVASNFANKAFVSYIYNKLLTKANRRIVYSHLLRSACEEVNGVAFEYSKFDDSYEGMGTTLVGGIINNNGEAHLINVGDSRAYLISDMHKTITQITKDHSLVEELVEVGVLTREEALTHPQKNVITRAVGSEADVEADYFTVQMRMGDVILLCSDGLSNTLTDDEILAFVHKNPNPEVLCNALLEEALARNVRDNVTIVAIMR